jgi:nucleoid-associated protein YgaU
MGGALRALAWVVAAMGAAILVAVLFAYRGSDIQRGLQEKGKELKERMPQLPELPGLPVPPAPGASPGQPQEPAAGETQSPAPIGTGEAAAPAPAAGSATPPPTGKPAPAAYTVANPPPVAKARHVVTRGETLYMLAETYYENGALWPLIAEANGLKSPAELREGMEIVIPGR